MLDRTLALGECKSLLDEWGGRVLASPALSAADRRQVHFLLGRAYLYATDYARGRVLPRRRP